MKIKLLLFAGLVSLAACQQQDDVAPNQDVEALYTRFHGRYRPLTSISSEALDVNLDGKASTNMFEEIEPVKDAEALIGIYGKNRNNQAHSFVFSLRWPHQETDRPEPTDYDPGIRPFYTTKVVFWAFAFDDHLSQLLVEPIQLPAGSPEFDFYLPPQAVRVKDNDQIEVTLRRRLYTTSGWKIVQIVTLFERYIRTT